METSQTDKFLETKQRRHTVETPLVVDLDNSLLRIDVLAEWGVRLLLTHPIKTLRILSNSSDLVELKTAIARNFNIRPELLPLNQKVLELIEKRRQIGGQIIIASASLPEIAGPIAEANSIDTALASEGENLKGEAKRRALVELFGEGGYDYVGDSKSDLPVWRSARNKFFAGRSTLLPGLEKVLEADLFDVSEHKSWKASLRGLRPSHWVKNLLLAVPLVLAGDYSNADLLPLGAAFLGFSLVASGLYLLNDLLDVDADRAHTAKRHRPIANGDLSAQNALILSALLIAAGLATSLLGAGFVGFSMTLAYGLGSLAYSLKVKTIPYIDLLGLAGLYVFRIVAGALVTATYISYWMMLFALMTFAALAALKRVTELSAGSDSERASLFRHSRRGYGADDLQAVKSLAASFSVSSIALLGIYAQETFTRELQAIASLLLVCSFAVWLLKFWLDSSRGKLSHDPIKHALSDKASLALLAITFGLYFWLSWGF